MPPLPRRLLLLLCERQDADAVSPTSWVPTDKCRFETELTSLEPRPDSRGWTAAFRGNSGEAEETFARALLATGVSLVHTPIWPSIIRSAWADHAFPSSSRPRPFLSIIPLLSLNLMS